MGTSGNYTQVKSYRQFYRNGYLFHVTNHVDNEKLFTVTEHDTGMTAGQWVTGTIDATITAFNNFDILKTVVALENARHLRGAN